MLVEADPEGGATVEDSGAPPQPKGALRYSDADFLRLVGDERRRSIGFGEGDTGILAKVRITSQEYRQGILRDLKVIEGRSKANDTTLSEAVDTVMPDIMEVFFGGDDVVTFDADGPGDEDQARLESDVLARVIFGQNDAFRAFHDNIMDALLNRTGVWYWWWEEKRKPLGAQTASSIPEALAINHMVGQQVPWAQSNFSQNDDGTIALEFAELRGRVVFKAVPSEDFTVAADTIVLRNGAYCALRDRPRVQDLIERGVDAALARSLPHYASKQDAMERARDEAGEQDRGDVSNGIDDLRVVEVRTHFLRVDADQDGVPEIWRVETDSEETILLRKEVVTHIPFAANTPYLVAHRFYGEGLFDKLAEIQRIKTVLLRMLLDCGYFALNQRYEVSEQAANEFTVADLLNNAPNVPVRSKNGQAVRPLQAGALNFDVFSALEFMSTLAEQRSGVVRNAQGLNPDTLHDTATGAIELLSAAQKRVRMICRVFAETGVKDLFLGVHQMLREHSTDEHRPLQHQVGPKQWAPIQPQSWQEREALTVHVGVGSSMQARSLQVQGQALELTEKVIEMQGGSPNGPFVTAANVYNRLKAFSRAMGEKDPSLYWTDPGNGPVGPPPGQGGPAAAEMAKVQSEHALQTQRMQMEAQASQAEQQSDQQLASQKLQADIALARQKMIAELQLEREKAAAELQQQRQEMFAEFALRRQELAMQISHSPNIASATSALPGGTA